MEEKALMPLYAFKGGMFMITITIDDFVKGQAILCP